MHFVWVRRAGQSGIRTHDSFVPVLPFAPDVSRAPVCIGVAPKRGPSHDAYMSISDCARFWVRNIRRIAERHVFKRQRNGDRHIFQTAKNEPVPISASPISASPASPKKTAGLTWGGTSGAASVVESAGGGADPTGLVFRHLVALPGQQPKSGTRLPFIGHACHQAICASYDLSTAGQAQILVYIPYAV
jgi:hypothetical protein